MYANPSIFLNPGLCINQSRIKFDFLDLEIFSIDIQNLSVYNSKKKFPVCKEFSVSQKFLPHLTNSEHTEAKTTRQIFYKISRVHSKPPREFCSKIKKK